MVTSAGLDMRANREVKYVTDDQHWAVAQGGGGGNHEMFAASVELPHQKENSWQGK